MKENKVMLNIYRVMTLLLVALLVYTNKERIEAFLNRDKEPEAESVYEKSENVSDLIFDNDDGQNVPVPRVDGSVSTTYADERKPDYSQVNTFVNDPVTVEYTWTSFEGLYYATICYTIDQKLYDYYSSLTRYYGNEEYAYYVEDPINDQYLDMIVENMTEIGDKRGYSDGERVREAISFCQSFEYETDQNTTEHAEWPKYPIELLYERKGDCEDTAIMLVGMLKKMGYGCALIKFDNHIAAALKGDDTLTGTYYEFDGNKYYYIETTNRGWQIGEMPEEYEGLPATIIVIN